MKKIGENGEALGVEVRATRCKNQTCFQKYNFSSPPSLLDMNILKVASPPPPIFNAIA
jgi:hypothetical protein